jgi:hypothetical protein
MSNGLSSIGALAYQGTNAPTPPNTASYKRAPTPNDYQGFSVGDFWIYRVSKTANNSLLYVLMGVAGNVADWVLLSNSIGVVTNLETDDGHIVTPTAGVINILGGTGIATTGTVGPNTVTISTAGDVATSYITNPATGTAVPVAGVLTFAGTGGAVISAAGSTITVNAGSTGDVTGLHTQDGHTVTPTAGVINISGGNNLTTTGTVGPNTATISLSGITQHSLQVGGASNALTQLGVATNGQLAIGSTGADPVLATLTAGTGVTITNGAGSITIAASGVDAQSFPTDSGTATPSSGVLNVNGNGAGGSISTTGSGNTIHITDINKPAFLVVPTASATNATGDGTFFTVPWATALTNVGSHFNTGTYTFTAPVNGLYYFGSSISLQNLGVAFTQGATFFVTTSIGYEYLTGNLGVIQDANNQYSIINHVLTPMSAGDTCYVQVSVAGGTKTITVAGGHSGNTGSWFYGYLVQVT